MFWFCQGLVDSLEWAMPAKSAASVSVSTMVYLCITTFVAGMALMTVLYSAGPGQKEMVSYKQAWGESMATVDALAQGVTVWSREAGHDRLPEDLRELEAKLPPEAKGAMYFFNGDAANGCAYAAVPLLTSPTRAPVPGYTYTEIRRPTAKSLPPAFMAHGLRIATPQGFQEMLAGRTWTVQVVR
ncbi:MAG: hypothetical protein ACO1TE_08955 [Prosthecobacter sp.]